MNCPHCNAELRQHGPQEGASKAGAFHCDGCGCCFTDGKTPREGTPVCGRSPAPAPAVVEAEPEAEEETEEEDDTESEPTTRTRSTRRTRS